MKTLKPNTGSIMPSPALLVSCRNKEGKNNALAVGFASNVSMNPQLIMVGIVPTHYSHEIIEETGEFVVNFPKADYMKEYLFLGTKSGRDMDKFAEMNIKWKDGDVVNAPILTDCAVALECKVVASERPANSDHTVFYGSIVAVHCQDEYVRENGTIDWKKIPLLSNFDLLP